MNLQNSKANMNISFIMFLYYVQRLSDHVFMINFFTIKAFVQPLTHLLHKLHSVSHNREKTEVL